MVYKAFDDEKNKNPANKQDIMKAITITLLLIILITPAYAYTITNTNLQGTEVTASGNIIAFVTFEDDIDEDLNGDNDLADHVIQYYDISKDRIRNTGREGTNPSVYEDLIVFEDKSRRILIYNTDNKELIDTKARGTQPTIFAQKIGFATKEKDTGDLNGDDDDTDTIIQYYDLITEKTTSTNTIGENPIMLKHYLVFETDESSAEEDLNRDGDRNDKIIQYYDFENDEVVNTRITGTKPAGFKQSPIAINDGEIYLLNLETRKTQKTGLTANTFSLHENMLAIERDGKIFVYNIEQDNEQPTSILGTEPAMFDNMIAYITEDRKIALLTGDDEDKDNIPDFADNCPSTSNYEQTDSNNNNIGDACDVPEPIIETVAPAQNITVPEPTAQTIAEQPIPEPEPLPERRELPETTMLEQEKTKDKSPAYWFLVAVGITMIGIILYVVVPRWTKKKKKSFGF